MGSTRKNKRLKASTLASRLMNYDVVSFDIFDTLILRNVSDPKNVFAFLATKYSLLDFGKIRIEVESKLRNKKQQEYGHREITINEIYDEVYKFTSIDPEVGIRNELEEEKNFCYANPYMKIVYDTLIQNGKKVIITSDMYLPHDLMAELLENCGYTGYDKLFVSCDYDCSKRNLGLYEYIKENYLEDDETVIHVGDNRESDFISARKVGWDAYHYPQNRDLGKPLDKIGMSYMIASYYTSIVNNFLYNGINEEYPYNQMSYYYGFMYGGLFILGYVNWIHEKALANKMDKVIFLARDGYILKKVYDMLYDDIPSEYALWSRHASMKTSLKTNMQAYIWQFVKRRKKSNPNITVENILKDMEFECLISKLEDVGIRADDTVEDDEIEENLINLIVDNYDNVKQISKKYSEATKQYYQEILGDAKKVCIVDIGWRGSGAISLKYLFDKEWNLECEVKALVAGTYKIYNNRDETFQTNKDVESYMFSSNSNTDILFKHQRNNAVKNTVVEIFTTAPVPSFLKAVTQDNKDSYNLKFDIPEVENYEDINLIFKGEIDFVKEYMKHINNHPELLNIPGRDAYMPLNYLMVGKRFENFKKTFKDLVYNILIGGIKDNTEEKFETFGEVCSKNWKG